jgi:hypothetical protein
MQETGLGKDKSVSWFPTGEGHDCGTTYKTEHLTTEWIADLSATFCMELMACGTPESVFSPSRQTHAVEKLSLKNSDDPATPPTPRTKENLLRTVLNAQKGETFKTADAAIVLGVSTRTVSRWANDGSLRRGPKRGSITAASIQRQLKSERGSESSL